MARGMMITLKPDGNAVIEMSSAKVTLEQAQQIVGGQLQTVPLFVEYKGVPCQVYCDEEGKLKNYEVNMYATAEWAKACNCSISQLNDVLVGTVLILTGSAMLT